MNVLGIHSFTHDSAAALVVDGRLRAFAQEERSSRVKGDGAFPAGAISTCLAETGLLPEDIDRVSIPFRPAVGALRRLAYLGRRPLTGPSRLAGLARKSLGLWGVERRLRQMGIQAPVAREDHYLCHALAVFSASPFESASVLVVDGVAEAWSGACFRATRFPEPRLEEISRLPFPHSLGLIYAAVTEHLGFRHNCEEGKVMAMAACEDARFQDAFSKICSTRGASVRVAQEYFDFGGSWTTPHFHRAFCQPRLPGAPLLPEHFALARALQRTVEDSCLTLATHLLGASGCPDLCFTGGLALNPALNSALEGQSGCRAFYALPAGGDPGAALGAALLGKGTPDWHLEHAFWGRGWGATEVDAALSAAGVISCAVGPAAVDRAGELLANGAIGGVFRGRAEMGPRALGHRSIVADPRGPHSRERLNHTLKRREAFQPFAPAALARACLKWFPGGSGSPYMLRTITVLPETCVALASVVHQDRTARLQTVEEGDASGLSPLLESFERRSGIPILLNTSLNRRGEPLADSPGDALAIFRGTDLDFLLLEDRLVVREGLP